MTKPRKQKHLLAASCLTMAMIGYNAQSNADAIDTTHQFQIKPQALQTALNTFSEQSQLQLFYSTELVKNHQTSGVTGEMNTPEALKALLKESGLKYRVIDENTITLEKSNNAELSVESLMAAAGEFVLAKAKPEEDYTGPVEQEDLTVSGRELSGYSVINASTATKTDTPILETLASIQVVSRSVMDDQQVIKLDGALKNVSGVFKAFDFGGQIENFSIRGFELKRRIFRDGFLNPSFNEYETADLERIEVLKGPAGFLYGRIEPGGLINLVTKRPQADPYYSVQQQFGSYDLYRTSIDATGAIPGTEETLLYRLNASYLSNNSFRDFGENERKFIAPSFTLKLGESTQLDFDFYYKDEDVVTDYGILPIGNRPADLPRNRALSEPDDKSSGETYQETVTLTHRFNEDWQIKGHFVKHDRDEFVRATGPLGLNEATGVLDRFFFAGPNDDDTTFYNIDLTGHFDTWGVEHTLLLGGDYYDNEHSDIGVFSIDGFTSTSGLFPAPINIFNPQYGVTPIDLSQEQNNVFTISDSQWFGFYLQDQLQVVDKLHILAGVRYDNAKSSVSNAEDGSNAIRSRDEEFSQRYGLLYQPVSWLSVYGSYVDSFNAANNGIGVAQDGSALGPERSHQYEAGLKGEWFDGNLSTTVAFYKLTKENIATAVSGRPGVFALTGEAESKGVEVDIAGQITDNWNIVATYSYTDIEITADDNKGNRMPNVPRHAGSLWTNYQFKKFGLPGLKAGTGIFLIGQREGDLGNSFQLPGYGRVDTSLGYSWNIGQSRVSAQLNIENLLDKKYFSASEGVDRSRISFGTPRTFLGMVRVEF